MNIRYFTKQKMNIWRKIVVLRTLASYFFFFFFAFMKCTCWLKLILSPERTRLYSNLWKKMNYWNFKTRRSAGLLRDLKLIWINVYFINGRKYLLASGKYVNSIIFRRVFTNLIEVVQIVFKYKLNK